MVGKKDIVRLLREDVAGFSSRRSEDAAFGPGLDLSGVELAGASLVKADLSRTDLSRANLRGADLREANLANAVLESSNLRNADLTGASLHRARLQGADLRGARVQFEDNCRMCMHIASFQGVHWDRQQIEAMLEVINRNADWLVHSHPTLSEALKEAALAAQGRAIHI